ncbi:MAG: translocation/assembly module TamB [Bacteroidales bacterium]|jgi:hypothetical protein|nr:translocation/assembly module TamB [Bacteroidales bacterium]
MKNTVKVIIGFAVLLLIVTGMLHSVFFTSWLGKKGSEIASEYIGYPIYFNKIDLSIFTKTAAVTNFQILDRNDSNMLSADRVTATLKSYDFKNFTIKNLVIVNPDWYIHVPKGDTSPDFEIVLQRLIAFKKDTVSNPFLIENARAIRGKFRYNNENYEWKGEHAIDFKHINIENFNVDSRNISVYRKQISFIIDHTDFIEKNGFKADDFEGFAEISPRSMHFTKIKIKTPESKFGIDLHFNYKSYRDFKDFINRVKMDGEINEGAILDLSDLAYFAYPLRGMDGVTQVAGKVSGTVSDLRTEGIRIKGGNNFNIETDVYLSGLLNYKNTKYDINIKKFSITKEDLKYITLPDRWQFEIPKQLDAFTDLDLHGTFTGKLDDFVAEINLNSNLGTVIADLRLGHKEIDTSIQTIRAKTDIIDLQLGKILSATKWFGATTASLNVSSEGHSLKNMSHNISGKINSFVFNDATIYDIDADVNIEGKKIDGNINANDRNVDFDLMCRADFRDTAAKFYYDINLRNINLQALKLVSDTMPLTLSSKIKGRNVGTDLDNLYCDIELKEIELSGNSFGLTLPRIALLIDEKENSKHFTLISDLLKINIDGEFVLSKIPKLYTHLKQIYFDEEVPEEISATPLPNMADEIMPDQKFTASVTINGVNHLAGVFSSELQLSHKLTFDISCNTKENKYKLHADIPYVTYKKFGYINGQIDLFTVENVMFIRTTADKLFLDDSMYMAQFLFQTNFAGHNTFNWGIHWLNNDINGNDTNFSYGNIRGNFSYFENQRKWKLSVDTSGMRFYDRNWIFSPNSFVEGDPERITVNNFSLRNGHEAISASGVLSKDMNSKLEIKMDSLNISYLDVFFKRAGIDPDGYISGKIELWDVYKNMDIVSDISMERFHINGDNYGTIGLKTRYDKSKSALLGQIDISLVGGKIPLLSLNGTFYPKKNNALDFEGTAKNLPINFLENYLLSFSSDISGTVSGTMKLGGTLKKPEFYTDVQSKDFAMSIDILNTSYTFDTCRIIVTPTEISFPTAVFHESTHGGTGRLRGKITHKNFKNISPNLHIRVANVLALNVPFSKATAYSGTVFASGTCDIDGSVSDNMKITVNGRTEKNSTITFNTESAFESSRDFIKFKDNGAQDDVVQEGYTYFIKKEQKEDTKTPLLIELNIDGTPDILVNMGIKNSVMSGHLSARGRGQMKFISNPDVTQLFGTYTVNSGTFDFSMMGLMDKQFILRNGSTISWTGPLKEAQLNVDAVYTTRTSLAPILSEGTFQGNVNQKVNVESILEMQGLLSNPNISFDINLLTINQEIKDIFSGIVNKENLSEMFRQTFSLLLFNNFMSVEGGLMKNNVADNALSSSPELLLGQFNNFISQLSKNVDFGVNYRPGNEANNSEVQIMVGLQFFDNRLIVEGSMGIDVDKSAGETSNPSGIVGDVNVEFKVTDKISLKAFNRSDEKDILKSGVSYTQGVGVGYRRDFDSFKDLIVRKRPKKPKKTQ